MSAELLREAATKMRERAQALQSGPWHVQHIDPAIVGGPEREHAWYVMERTVDESGIRGRRGPYADCDWEPSAEHIAAWSPAVALAVADWLDVAADHWDNSEHVVNTIAYTDGPEDECDEECPACQREEAATEVARAYLSRPE